MVEQVGGDHYQVEFQHWDWVVQIGLGYLAGNATKYLVRWRQKNGIEDLLKSRSYLVKILETRDDPGSGVHYRVTTVRERMLTDDFIEVNKIPETEAAIIWCVVGVCSEAIVEHAITLIDKLIAYEKMLAEHGEEPSPRYVDQG